MEQLRKDDRSLFEKIIDFFKNLFTASKGTQFEQDVKAIYDRLNGLLENVSEYDKNATDTRYSLEKSRKNYYNEFNTLAMQWAYSASTKPGDVKIFNNNGKYFTLIEATGDGYVELASGNYKEVKKDYDYFVSQQTDSIYESVESYESGRDQRYGGSVNDEIGKRNDRNSEQIKRKGLQDYSAGNIEDLRGNDKEISGEKRQVKYSNGIITPTEDKAYLNAVNNGDIETAQKLL